MNEKTMKLYLLASEKYRKIIEDIFGEEVCCLTERQLTSVLDYFTPEEIMDLCNAFRMNGKHTYSWIKEYLQKRDKDLKEENAINLYSKLDLPILETHMLVKQGILQVDSTLSEEKQKIKTRKN